MRALHLCFWLHHPYELLGAGKWEKGYFGGENEFKKIDKRDCQPLFALLERNAQRYPKMRVSLVVSGVWLEQAERWDRELVRRLQKLVESGNVEPVATPYYYSMVAFYELDELKSQLERTQEKFEQLFGQKSVSVALPELCYQNRLARWIEKLGFQVMLAGDATRSLDWRTSNRVYDVKGCQQMRALFANQKLSRMVAEAQDAATIQVEDEIKVEQIEVDADLEAPKVVTAAEFVQAFNQSGEKLDAAKAVKMQKQVSYRTEFSAKKYQKQLDLAFLRGDIVTLHFDPEIFGKWREIGIIGFFDELFKIWSETTGNSLVSAQDVLALAPASEISVKHTISRTGETEKDYHLPDWWSPAQDKTTLDLMKLRKKILASEDADLYLDFAHLTTMDYALGGEQYDEILADINEKVSHFVVQTEDGKETVIPNKLAESTTVKVKINRKPEPEPEIVDDATEGGAVGEAENAESAWETDDADDMEAAIQVMAQRMKWHSMNEERDVGDLAEAEVVSEDVRVDYEEADFNFDDELEDVFADDGLDDAGDDEDLKSRVLRAVKKPKKDSKTKTGKTSGADKGAKSKKKQKKIVID